MLVCPLDFRYGREEMKSIFSEEHRLRRLLDVEVALAKAHAFFGNIPANAAQEIEEIVSSDAIKLERVKQIESEIGHDLMAVVQALAEKCTNGGKYVHLGATSSDIIDTAVALQLKEAMTILRRDLMELRSVLVQLAKRHKGTVMLGRTHGQAAIPMTFGLKMVVYASEVNRHVKRLDEASKRICVGKMSGAVGTGAALGEQCLGIQQKAMEFLDLEAEEASSQTVGRDRYAEFIALLANIVSSAEKFATEVRNLQRTEIGEVSEAFEIKKQVGSSTMAQKQNPVISENICGLSRIVRAFLIPTFENIPLWHERDLTNSSSERFIIPHSCILTDDILAKLSQVYRTLRIDEERMLRNIQETKGQIMGEAVMIALTRKGVGRREAYDVVRKCALEAREKGIHLKEVLMANELVRDRLAEEEVEAALDPLEYIGASKEIVENVIKTLEG